MYSFELCFCFTNAICLQVSFPHSIAATAIVPVSVHVVMLGGVMFFMGMALGGLDNGRYL